MGVNIDHIPSNLTKSLTNYKSLSMDSFLIFQIHNHVVNGEKFIFCFPLTRARVKSMKTENIVPMTICSSCLFSKSLLKIRICEMMRIRLKTKVTVPTLKWEIRLQTLGMQISGAVPKLALIDNDAPNDMKNSESR